VAGEGTGRKGKEEKERWREKREEEMGVERGLHQSPGVLGLTEARTGSVLYCSL